jgi:Zn-dependent protease with chaperone function
MHLKYLLIGLAATCLNTISFAQTARHLPYFTPNAAAQRTTLAEKIIASLAQTFQPPTAFNKQLKEDYQKRAESIRADIGEEIEMLAITDDILWPGLQRIHQQIVMQYPALKNTQVLLLANPTPNAISIGDGTFLVYVGLMAGLENEDQMAFVLCHEMAHFLLKHSTQSLENEVRQVNDPAFIAKVKALQKEEFNRAAKVEAFINKLLLKNRYHSRDHELAADSLAYQLYLSTGYSPQQAQRMMEVFEDIDHPLGKVPLELKSHFGCDAYPFQSDWASTSSAGSVWGAAREASKADNQKWRDSVSTHPEWADRLKALNKLMGTSTATVPNKAGKGMTDYQQLRYLATLESIDAWRKVKRYDMVLFLAVQYQSVHPDCAYLKEMKALALAEMYLHLKDHDLASVLSASRPEQDEPYRNLLNFLNERRIKELLALAECSVSELLAEKSEFGLLAEYQLASAKADNAAMARIKRTYLKQYKTGRFNSIFTQE